MANFLTNLVCIIGVVFLGLWAILIPVLAITELTKIREELGEAVKTFAQTFGQKRK